MLGGTVKNRDSNEHVERQEETGALLRQAMSNVPGKRVGRLTCGERL